MKPTPCSDEFDKAMASLEQSVAKQGPQINVDALASLFRMDPVIEEAIEDVTPVADDETEAGK